MSKITYQILERRQKLHIKAYLILCVVLLISVGFYSYKKWQIYSVISSGLETQSSQVELLKSLESEKNAQYEATKKQYDKFQKEIEDNLATIFPSDDNYTILTRQIDTYEKDLAKKNDPFEVSNIDFQTVVEAEQYSILPFRMNIRSSAANFTKFLHLIENSGSLKENARLMDISSIRLNFQNSGSEEAGPEIINFTVQINAYFQ